jgi:hypothetical protein
MADHYLRKYGIETTLNFELYDTDGASLQTGAAHAAGDTNIMKDEGAEDATDNGFTDEGRGYSIVLTATEMEAARVMVYVVDQTSPKAWIDKVLIIETYGDASAQHAFDLDTATQNVNVSSISNDAITAAAIATGAIDADAIADSAIDAGAIAADAITSAKFAAGAIDAAAIATGAVDADALASDAVDEILDEVFEGTLTVRQGLRIFLAALAGKSSGGGTGTIAFRDNADGKDRISATVDANNNRTAVSLDGS